MLLCLRCAGRNEPAAWHCQQCGAPLSRPAVPPRPSLEVDPGVDLVVSDGSFSTEEFDALEDAFQALLEGRCRQEDFLALYEPIQDRMTRYFQDLHEETWGDLESDPNDPHPQQMQSLLRAAREDALAGLETVERFLDGQVESGEARRGMARLVAANGRLILALELVEVRLAGP